MRILLLLLLAAPVWGQVLDTMLVSRVDATVRCPVVITPQDTFAVEWANGKTRRFVRRGLCAMPGRLLFVNETGPYLSAFQRRMKRMAPAPYWTYDDMGIGHRHWSLPQLALRPTTWQYYECGNGHRWRVHDPADEPLVPPCPAGDAYEPQ